MRAELLDSTKDAGPFDTLNDNANGRAAMAKCSITSYPTKQDASAAALRTRYPLLRYKCKRCGCWHLRRKNAG